MRYFLLLCTVILCSCETHTFDGDKRQIIAKDEVRKAIRGRGSQFDVVSFTQDTLTNFPDTLVQSPLRYTLHFTYVDSSGTHQQKTAHVLFARNGLSVLNTQIVNQP